MKILYKIENNVNKNVYIGQTNNFSKRRSHHFKNLNKNNHKNRFLQEDYNKFGKQNFKMVKLLQRNVDNLDLLEKLFIYHEQNNVYNIQNGGIKDYKHSLLSKQKMSKSHTNKKLSSSHKNDLSLIARKNKQNKSIFGFSGVYYYNKKSEPWYKVWVSGITYKGKRKTLGVYNEPLSGHIVYNFVKKELDELMKAKKVFK